eukprot:gene10649-3273_t
MSQTENTTMWVYTALHGSYGIFWALKSHWFGDSSWEQPGSFLWEIYVTTGLILFWSPGFIISYYSVTVENWYLFLCIIIYSFGIFFHFASDMQKTVELEYNKGNLITKRIWSISRNPNYFGELLIYTGFSMLAKHWFPLIVVLSGIITVWIPNMKRKDKSLSRYKEFKEYSKKTSFWIPGIY